MNDDPHSTPHATAQVTEVLREEHEAITLLIDEIDRTDTPEQKQYLMDEIERRFTSHSEFEDQLLSATLAVADSPAIVELAETALAADREACNALREIASMFPWARGYDREVERIIEKLRSHFAFEEEDVFPVIR